MIYIILILFKNAFILSNISYNAQFLKQEKVEYTKEGSIVSCKPIEDSKPWRDLINACSQKIGTGIDYFQKAGYDVDWDKISSTSAACSYQIKI